VKWCPLEELEAVLETLSNGTVRDHRYFLQTVEELAHRYGVRAWPSTSYDFPTSLDLLKELARGSLRGAGEHQPRHPLRAAEVIPAQQCAQRSAGDDRQPGLSAAACWRCCGAASHVLCDRAQFCRWFEQTLAGQNRSS